MRFFLHIPFYNVYCTQRIMTTYIQAVLNVHVVKTCNINSRKMWVKKRKQCFMVLFFFHLIFQLCQEAYVFSWVHALSSIAGAVFEENVLWKAASTSSWNMSIEITDTIRFLTSHLSLTPNYHDITKHLTVSLFSARHVAQYTYMKSDIKVKTCNPCNEKKERSIICSNMFA